MPTIVLRRKARDDLNEIDSFSRENFGNVAADKYMMGIDGTLEQLARYPESGSSFRFSSVPLRSIRAGSHRILYQFDGRRVIVVRVLHHAMDAGRHIRS